MNNHAADKLLGEQLPVWRHQFSQRQKLSGNVQNLLEQRDKFEKEQEVLNRSRAKQVRLVIKTDQDLKTAEQSAQELEQQYQQSLGEKSEDVWRDRLQRYQQRQLPMQKLEEVLKQNREEGKRLHQQQLMLKEHESSLQEKQQELEQFRVHYHKEKQQLQDLETLVQQEQLIASLSDHRNRLQPGEACPLCGSHEHPAIEQYQQLTDSNTVQRWDEQKQLLGKMEEQGQAKRTDITKLQTQITATAQTVEEIHSRIDLGLSQWQTVCDELQIQLSINDQDAVQNWLEKQSQKIAQLTALGQRLDAMNRERQNNHQQLRELKAAADTARHEQEKQLQSSQEIERKLCDVAGQQQVLAQETRAIGTKYF